MGRNGQRRVLLHTRFCKAAVAVLDWSRRDCWFSSADLLGCSRWFYGSLSWLVNLLTWLSGYCAFCRCSSISAVNMRLLLRWCLGVAGSLCASSAPPLQAHLAQFTWSTGSYRPMYLQCFWQGCAVRQLGTSGRAAPNPSCCSQVPGLQKQVQPVPVAWAFCCLDGCWAASLGISVTSQMCY